ncbi:MAG: hypothetical protein RR277_00385 [Rikenellaceae bacterium]
MSSLSKERVQAEAKLGALKREIANKAIEVDMYIHTIREEASPFLSIDEIDIVRIKIAVSNLESTCAYIEEKSKEVRRLEKLL